MRISRSHRGFTLIEVLIALVVLLAGIVTIVQLFPVALRASADAALQGTAVDLAQQKVEEIRRDADFQSALVFAIKNRTTPTTPVTFGQDPRFTYSFCGTSLQDPDDTPGDARDDIGVARVLVQFNESFRPDRRVLYEMRFDQ